MLKLVIVSILRLHGGGTCTTDPHPQNPVQEGNAFSSQYRNIRNYDAATLSQGQSGCRWSLRRSQPTHDRSVTHSRLQPVAERRVLETQGRIALYGASLFNAVGVKSLSLSPHMGTVAGRTKISAQLWRILEKSRGSNTPWTTVGKG